MLKIKMFRVESLSAKLTAGIVSSDVTATGMIADRSISGSVDMVDVAVVLSNPNILKDADNISVACRGEIFTKFNDDQVAGCTLAPSCLKCE